MTPPQNRIGCDPGRTAGGDIMGRMKQIAMGMALFCMIAGIVLIGMDIAKVGKLLVPGLALVVVGLGAGAAARASKTG